MHYSERPINFYRNQIVFEIGQQPIEKIETPFLNYNRVTIQKPEYTENDIQELLRRYHNGKQTAILVPQSLFQSFQNVYKHHFDIKGHFVITATMIEDVTNEQRQDIIVQKEHDRAHRGIREVEQQLIRSYFSLVWLKK